MGAETKVLGGVAGGLSFVCFCAGVGGGAARDFPFVGPVAVDVAADAGVAADGLTVLAPQTVRRLGVDEAVGVDDRGDVEVELVDERLDGGVRGVLCEQLPCEVLGGHGGDPFSGVYVAVDNDGWFGALSAAAPDMDSGEDSSLD